MVRGREGAGDRVPSAKLAKPLEQRRNASGLEIGANRSARLEGRLAGPAPQEAQPFNGLEPAIPGTRDERLGGEERENP